MKTSPAIHISAKVLLSALLFASPLLLPAQSKKNNPPPQQQQQSKPAPAPQPQPQRQQPQQQAQPQRQQPPQQQQPVHPQGPGPGAGGAAPNRGGTGTGAGGAVPNRGGIGTGAGGAVPNRGGTGTGTGGVAPNRGGTGVGNSATRTAGPLKLAPVEAQKQIQERNKNREKMSGVNRIPLPTTGQVTLHPNGAKTIDASRGRRFDLRADGTVQRISVNNGSSTATFRPNGTISSVRATGIQIDRNSNGSRTIVTDHNGQHLVSTGAGRGYLQRNYVERNGRTYVQRTYVVNNTTYVTVYRNYSYRGVTYYNYVPVYYYQPVFYGWVYNPWPAPVYFAWGWNAEPWYGPYGYYFTPYPVYPTAAYWMTDYIIAENLRAAYEAGEADANAGNNEGTQQQGQGDSVPLSPQVKDMIAEEVKAQLAAEREAAAQSANSSNSASATPASSGGNSEQVPPALDPNVRVFIVTTAMDVSAEGQACSLSPGDVLMRTDTVADSQNTVPVSVLSSKRSDCATGAATRVQVEDLQEMHNHFREKMDNGMKTLADKQGRSGLPSAPSVRTVSSEVPPPTADSAAAVQKRLKGQQQEADQAEKDIQQQAFAEKTS